MYDAGFTPVPCMAGTKNPSVQWGGWHDQRPLREDMERYFSRTDTAAMLMGSGGLEVIDIDTKHDPDFALTERMLEVIQDTEIWEKLYVEYTPSRGLHLFYKAEKPSHSSILAWRFPTFEETEEETLKGKEAKNVALIEHKCKGALCHIFPSPGYDSIQGDILNLPELTPGEVAALANIARAFDETSVTVVTTSGGRKPGEHFAEEAPIHEVVSILEQAGWRVLRDGPQLIQFNRPGARNSKGVDATIKKSARTFLCFSTSDPTFSSDQAYSFFSVFTLVRCAGDYKAAAKLLGESGWGDKFESGLVATGAVKQRKPQMTQQEPLVDMSDEELMFAELLAKPFDINKMEAADFKLFAIQHPKKRYDSRTETPLIGLGMSLCMAGIEKSRKTSVLTSVIASALADTEVCGFHYKARQGSIVWLDTEQGPYYYQQTQRRVFIQAGLKETPQDYHAYSLSELTHRQRCKFFVQVVEMHKPEIVVIDGIRDLLNDINKNDEVAELMQLLKKLQRHCGFAFFTVLHFNKNSSTLRGTIGTEIQNKFDCVLQVALDDTDNRRGKILHKTARGPRMPDRVDFEAGPLNIPYLVDIARPKFDYSIGALPGEVIPTLPESVEAEAPKDDFNWDVPWQDRNQPVITKPTRMDEAEIPF